MTTGTRPTTAEQLLHMPDDGFRYELVRGELRKMVPAGQAHGDYVTNVNFSLTGHARANRLGKTYPSDTGFFLAGDPDHVRAPDVAFVTDDRLREIGRSDRFIPGPPDLAVEVISPSDRYTEVDEKTRDYLAAGTLAVVVVDPRRRAVTVHRPGAEPETLGEADVLAVEDVVPGWRMRVGEIFE